MLHEYRGFWISGTAGMVNPFILDAYPSGPIYKLARPGSVEELSRFALRSFKMTDQDGRVFRAGTA